MNGMGTEIIFLLDRSGSMAGLEKDTIGGFNAFIEKQQVLEEETKVTAVLFDDKYELLWNGVNAQGARLTDKEYYVRGYTALLDAVGQTIIDVRQRLTAVHEETKPGKVIFVITTDGYENASREFTYSRVKELITQQQEEGWSFIFLGANIDAVKEADSFGIQSDHTYRFEASSKGVEMMYDLVYEAVLEVRQAPQPLHSKRNRSEV